MNYYTIRIIITIIILIILGLTSRYVIKNTSKKARIIPAIIAYLVISLVWAIMFERNFIKFDNVEDALKYNFPNSKIIMKDVKEDYAYILFTNKNSQTLMHYVTKDNKWQVDNEYGQNKLKNLDNYTVLINKVKNRNIFMISIFYSELLNDKEVIVTDSLNNEFEIINYLQNKNKMFAIVKVIEEDITKGYSITIDGKEYIIYK